MIDSTISSSFLTTAQYSSQQTNASSEQEELGRDAFLQLLTTQLNNQDPLDPMDNEAFVAQLAQFSSVEGIKGMQSSLENMVSGMRQDQMMAGASLVGKKVAVEGGLFEGGNGIKTNASINLENGADAAIASLISYTLLAEFSIINFKINWKLDSLLIRNLIHRGLHFFIFIYK